MRWRKILLGGVLAELLIFVGEALVVVIWGEGATRYSAPVWSLVMTGVAAWWVAPRERSVLHGAFMGALAAGLFTLLVLPETQPLEFWIAHGLKVAGGALGGWQAKMRRTRV